MFAWLLALSLTCQGSRHLGCAAPHLLMNCNCGWPRCRRMPQRSLCWAPLLSKGNWAPQIMQLPNKPDAPSSGAAQVHLPLAQKTTSRPLSHRSGRAAHQSDPRPSPVQAAATQVRYSHILYSMLKG